MYFLISIAHKYILYNMLQILGAVTSNFSTCLNSLCFVVTGIQMMGEYYSVSNFKS